METGIFIVDWSELCVSNANASIKKKKTNDVHQDDFIIKRNRVLGMYDNVLAIQTGQGSKKKKTSGVTE